MIDEGEPPSWVEYTMSVKLNSTIEIVDGDNVEVRERCSRVSSYYYYIKYSRNAAKSGEDVKRLHLIGSLFTDGC